MEITDKQIFKTGIIPCDVKTAWKKWTTHEGLLTFFGRDNKIELKPGGAFEIYFLMDNPYGLRGSETCKVISYLPKRMFSFSWNAPPNFPDIRDHEYKTWVVVLFEPSGNGTKIELYHTGWPEGENWDKVYDYFNEAWSVVMNSLEVSCK